MYETKFEIVNRNYTKISKVGYHMYFNMAPLNKVDFKREVVYLAVIKSYRTKYGDGRFFTTGNKLSTKHVFFERH